MEFSTSLNAIIRSNQATDHFDLHQQIQFDARSMDFSPENAWWLAELSRWMYAGKNQHASARKPVTNILNRVGLEETAYFSSFGTNCSLVTAKNQNFSVLVFRGTCNARNWLTNFNIAPLSNNAHRGYERALDHLWSDLGPALVERNEPVFFTGHSMGGALATLAARRCKPQAVYSFGAPPIGNQQLQEDYEGLSVFRVVNYKDIVSRVSGSWGHVGTQYYVTQEHSLKVNPTQAQVKEDRSMGPRAITQYLNQNQLLSIPECLCDHAPQNYIAHLERLSLGQRDDTIEGFDLEATVGL